MAKRLSKNKLNIIQKIIEDHLVDGEMAPGQAITIAIDQTMTQDSNGTLTYQQLEALGIDRVKTKTSVSYVDHNLIQLSFESADDHR